MPPPAPAPLPGRTFLGSAAAGFVLGAVIWRGPIYSLEIAQIAAGQVALPPGHPIYAHHTSVLSPFLVQIPAALLRLGVPELVLCVVMSGLVAALSFAAVSVCAWAFSRDRIFALAAPALLLAFDFAGHKYPLFFPVGEHDTGIAGLFAALLAVSLASLGPSRLAALSLGLVPAVHPTLAVAAWLGCASALAFAPPSARRAWLARWPWLCAGAVVLALGWAIKAILAPPPAEFLPASDDAISAMVSSVMLHFDYHRQPADLMVEPWRMLPFFETDVYWIGFLSALTWLGRSGQPARFLLRASLGWTAAAVLLTLLDEARPELLPLSVKVLMASRWLNLNAPLFTLAVLGSLVALSRARAHGVASAVLALLVSAIALGVVERPTALDADWRGIADSLSWNVAGAAFPIAALTVLALFVLDRRPETPAPRRAERSVAAVALVLAALLTLGRVVREHGVPSWDADGILQTEQDRVVFAAAREGRGLLVTPRPWAVPRAQLKTRRGILLDTEMIDVLPYAPRAAPAFERILKDVYGVSVLSPAGWRQFASLPALWRSRSTREWVRIGRTHGATQVLAPAHWRLALPEVARSPQLVLYRIPE